MSLYTTVSNPILSIPGLPQWDAHHSIWGMDEKYRVGYVRSKYSLARMYNPRRICEIGVYSGIAAHCFLAASPKATYIGIDNCSAEKNQGISVVGEAFLSMAELGYTATFYSADSQKLVELPYGPYDFIHVDGDHTPEGARHDVELAWAALTPDGVMLVDDCHNMQVVAGVAAALNPITDLLDWSYIDEGVGTMVIHRRERIR